MQKIELKLEKLEKALKALEAIYQKPTQADRSNIDATIQRFEFTFELFWKLLKEFFALKGKEIPFPRDVIQEAYLDKIIDNETLWLMMLKDRNLTSHTYDEALADEIFGHIQTYVPALRQAFNDVAKLIQQHLTRQL